jgi:hypothetical protein
MKFLIDECLSLDLVEVARGAASSKAPMWFGWAKLDGKTGN